MTTQIEATPRDYSIKKNNNLLNRIEATLDAKRLMLIAFLLGVLVMTFYRPLSRPEVGDPTIYDYVAQSILRGQLPYRDVIDIKSPGSQYLSAAAIKVSGVFGLRDIFAIRVLYVALVGLLCVVTCLVADAYLSSRFAAAIAFLIPLLREPIAKLFIAGTQPKLPMMIFGLLSLLMIARNRPLSAGIFSMLSCLCWQPGLMFTGTAVLIFSRYLTSWRDLKTIKVVVGAAIPLAIVLGYFYSRGALGDLWAWTITYNYSVFGPEAGPSLAAALRHIWVMSRGVFQKEILFVLLSVAGFAVFLFERLRQKRGGRAALRSQELFKDAIVFPPAIYFAFMLVNFQGPADLIPLFPFIGMFAGWLVVRCLRWLESAAPAKKWFSENTATILETAAIAAILIVLVYRAGTFKLHGLRLQDQDTAMQQLRQQLQPGDRFFDHGAAEILVLLNVPNLNPYIDLDWGKDEFVMARRGVTFQQIIDEIEAAAPKYVSIARLRKVYHRRELESWYDEHYEPLDLYKFNKLAVRKSS